jgi:hypothetical protein
MFVHFLINNVVELAKKTKVESLEFKKIPYHLFKLYNVSMIYNETLGQFILFWFVTNHQIKIKFDDFFFKV